MEVNKFKYLFLHETEAFYLQDHIIMFRDPLEIWDERTNEGVRFKTLEEALSYKLGGVTVADIIAGLDDLYIEAPTGGRGASSGAQSTFKFGSAKGAGDGPPSTPLAPAYANTKIKSKTFEGALNEFKRNHLLSNREFAYEVDKDGYVHQYMKGEAHSVGISTRAKVRRGDKTFIIHNHPGGGNFSDADLISTSMERNSRGIVASGKKHDYIFQKGSHFKAASFIKAVKTAEMKGVDYDDATHKWLKRNQKKYGYKYTRNKN